MSMLAEPRRKQKVINLRAKNNAWSNDSTKFGQRMLEKMGWCSGKGLGAKENGIVEHVIARYKNDEKGLGFEDRNDQWTKHEDDFNSLLANLSNADCSTDTLHSGISLEKKSKKSKARIHYHKFTRGKDLSRYSEKDLANIFGKKSFKEPQIQESITEKDSLKTTEQVFTDKGNMDDYFKNKLTTLKSKFNPDTNSKSYEESECTFQEFSSTKVSESNQNEFEYQPFPFYGSKVEDVCQKIEPTCLKLEIKSKKKNTLKLKEISCEAEAEEKNLLQNSSEVIPETVEKTKVKKSKKRKHNTVCSEETQSLDSVEESNSSECLQNPTQVILMDEESAKVRKSKKKKHIVGIEEPQSSDKVEGSDFSEWLQDQTPEILMDEVSTKVKKSKKKKYHNAIEDDQKNEEIRKEKKKNKKRVDTENTNLKHMSSEDNVPKKKRRNKDL